MKKRGKNKNLFLLVLLIILVVVIACVYFINFKITGNVVSGTNGLVAYYPFEGNANDASGNGNNGNLQGASLTTGKNGSGYRFDGIDDYIVIGNNIQVTPSITAIAWAKSSTSTWNTYGWIAGSRMANGFLISPWNNSKVVNLYIFNTSGDYIFVGSCNPGDITTWHQYGAGYDAGSNRAFTICDGLINYNPVAISRGSGTIGLEIGRDYGYVANRYGNGSIDSVKVWNYALNNSEVQAEYNSAPITPSPFHIQPATKNNNFVSVHFFWQHPFPTTGAPINDCTHHPADPLPIMGPMDPQPGNENYSRLVDYYYAGLKKVGLAHINAVIIPIYGQPSPVFKNASTNSIKAMLDAQDRLRQEGNSYPLIFFQADGIEAFDANAKDNEDYTRPGESIDEVWDGLQLIYDTIIEKKGSLDLQSLQTVNNLNTFPLMIYHPEDWSIYCQSHNVTCNVTANNTFIYELKRKFNEKYDKDLYIILDVVFYNKDYGNNKLHITDADNYYYWGAAKWGTFNAYYLLYPRKELPFNITSIGPGFSASLDCGKTNRTRDEQLYYNDIKNYTDPWIVIETFNVWGEGTEIDNSLEYGDIYLNLTRAALIDSGKFPYCYSNLECEDSNTCTTESCVNGNCISSNNTNAPYAEKI